jgi:hypothetical protein
MEYADHVLSLRSTHPDLAAEIASFRGLGRVMAWMNARGMKLADVDIIHQDEFSLDFVVPMTAAGTYLAFGIT